MDWSWTGSGAYAAIICELNKGSQAISAFYDYFGGDQTAQPLPLTLHPFAPEGAAIIFGTTIYLASGTPSRPTVTAILGDTPELINDVLFDSNKRRLTLWYVRENYTGDLGTEMHVEINTTDTLDLLGLIMTISDNGLDSDAILQSATASGTGTSAVALLPEHMEEISNRSYGVVAANVTPFVLDASASYTEVVSLGADTSDHEWLVATGLEHVGFSYGDPREMRSRNASLSPKSQTFRSRTPAFSNKSPRGGRH